MTPQLLLAFIGYAFVTSITPGPNNTLLLASGANHGFRASLPLLLGINFGFSGLVLAVGLGLGGLFSAIPVLHDILRYAGSAYLLYLAWKIARSAPLEPGAKAAAPLSFPAAAAFQWVNPKAWIMAVGAVAAYTPTEGYFLNLAIVVIAYALANGPCIAVWAIGGTMLRGLLSDPARQRVFNVVMGLLLAASLYPILAS
ncbi:MAG: lysine transporter LysE [Stutzerimonas stutzeri]|nr:MAG: lysine transporter LysE [Stutzerimonas stutzeri]